ncbi:MAG: hypothetical protein QM755_02310 [Luteolibacter sp.]
MSTPRPRPVARRSPASSKSYAGSPSAPTLVGGIELDYGTQEKTFLQSFYKEDLPTITVNSAIPTGVQADLYQGTSPPPVVRYKEPFLIATFQQKTERNSRFPSRSWLNNSPVNLYSSAGLDQTEDWSTHQYEFQWEAMTDWPPGSPTIEISNTGNRGYGGPGIYAQSGSSFATFGSLPLSPASSLFQLRHAPLNQGGQLPLTSQIIGGSHPHPLLPAASVKSTAGTRTFLDHCYLANNALFDSWFLSSAADRSSARFTNPRDARRILTEFFSNTTPLPDSRYLPDTQGKDPATLAGELTAADAYKTLAAYLRVDAPFNVNSTSVPAWEALLASNSAKPHPPTRTVPSPRWRMRSSPCCASPPPRAMPSRAPPAPRRTPRSGAATVASTAIRSTRSPWKSSPRSASAVPSNPSPSSSTAARAPMTSPSREPWMPPSAAPGSIPPCWTPPTPSPPPPPCPTPPPAMAIPRMEPPAC